jgi:geranylgeranyl pyrophosphate synthase
MHLLVNELLVSLPLLLGQAVLAEAISTHENSHILEMILLLLDVVLALHDGEVEDLTLISLVTMEGRNARTYLFDLHAVG